jgi:amino acid adenylation domain-containing protein
MNNDQVCSSPTPSADHTLIDLLQGRSRDKPEQIAYTFLLDGEDNATSLTYAALDRRARSIAALLGAAAPGERVLLLYPPGLEYLTAFFGCLYAGLVAVPAYPPHPNRPMPRLQTIVADAGATYALTTSALLAQFEQRFTHMPDLAGLHWYATDAGSDDRAAAWHRPPVTADTLAMLQYTSGSTAAPKGVMLSHRHLLHNQQMIKAGFGHTESAIIVGWLPLYHDMGLIGNVIQPLYLGASCILMAPVAFLQRPVRWLNAISRFRATTSGGPNFAYDLCARKITPEQRATLDLSSWDLAFCGAEPVRAATLARFVEVFGPCGFRREAFYPCYGLAEATLIVSGGNKHTPPVTISIDAAALERGQVVAGAAPDSPVLVGCGQPLPDLQLAIVQPEAGTRCGSDQVGEIWVSGPSVAAGYWNQPDVTEQTFHARIDGSNTGPFLRTGDLGFVRDGELFVTGRLKDLIIVRGRNHYPQDIELTVEESHPLLRPGSGAAFSIEAGDAEQLVIVQEVERQARHADLSPVFAAIRQAVAEQHEVQIHAIALIKPATIPKTSSGKIQRHACRTAFHGGSLELIAAWSAAEQATHDLPAPALLEHRADLQQWLPAFIARTCGVSMRDLALDQPITSYGLDSMTAIELTHGIEAQTGAMISIAALLQGPTLEELVAEIRSQMARPRQPADLFAGSTVEASSTLSYGQRALWFLHQLAPQSTAYTIANAVQVQTPLDVPALKRAAQALVDRHALLRATFPTLNGEPVLQVEPQQPVSFIHEDARGWSAAQMRQHLVDAIEQPFDLQHGPLLRVLLLSQDDQQVLALAAHHIVTDFWSQALLLQDLAALYTADLARLTSLTSQYSAYVQWQHAELAGPAGERLWNYWRQQLGDVSGILELPTDRPRPPVQTFNGAALPLTLDRELTAALKRFNDQHGVTLYITLLTAFHILLHRYTGQHDLLVGSPVAGRSRAPFADVVGYFVNPVALRAKISGMLSCADLLRQIQQTALAAFEHQEYPFSLLVERLQPDRDPSRPPLVQAMFALQQAPPHAHEHLGALALGIDGVEVALEGLRLRSVALPRHSAQFEIALLVAEVDGCLRGSWEYNTDLFEAATIQRMADHWTQVLHAMLDTPEQPVALLPLLTADEQRKILGEWNATAGSYDQDQTLHALFEAHAAQTPTTIAGVCQGRSLTYAELNARANQLAHHLRTLGVGPECCVGLCLPRSLDVLVGMLGILKAGGAYVPLDPAYPQERLAWMIEQSRIAVLVTHAALLDDLPSHAMPVLCLDRDWPLIAQAAAENPVIDVSAKHLAYVLYTSGSTGRPKGVGCHHRGVVNLLADFQRRQPLAPGMACSWWASLSFDVSVYELCSALVAGGTLHIVPDAARIDSLALGRWLSEHQIVSAYLPPFMLSDLAAAWETAPAPPLHRLVVGVEPIPEPLLARITAAIPGLQIINGYGPTETTVCAALYSLDPHTIGDEMTPIGRPVQNMQVYVLDAQMQPVPVGVVGEVFIGGVGVARGYLHQPERTAERFVPDPFSATPGTRLYRTGDLARYRADGNLMFIGRRDQQIKLRGYRIELGEIEAALMQHPAVREAVVALRQDLPGEKRLVAYVVGQANKEQRTTHAESKEQRTTEPGSQERTDDEAEETYEASDAESGAIGSSELRRFLQGRLPEYMVPATFVLLEALPQTPNDKVDRRALPLPASMAGPSTAYAAPQTEIEQVLAGIWQAVLRVERVGIKDNFFELGGHSLLIARVHSQLQAALGIDLPLTALFKYPTIERLAQYLSQEQPQTPAFQRSTDRAALRKEARRNRRRG